MTCLQLTSADIAQIVLWRMDQIGQGDQYKWLLFWEDGPSREVIRVCTSQWW